MTTTALGQSQCGKRFEHPTDVCLVQRNHSVVVALNAHEVVRWHCSEVESGGILKRFLMRWRFVFHFAIPAMGGGESSAGVHSIVRRRRIERMVRSAEVHVKKERAIGAFLEKINGSSAEKGGFIHLLRPGSRMSLEARLQAFPVATIAWWRAAKRFDRDAPRASFASVLGA